MKHRPGAKEVILTLRIVGLALIIFVLALAASAQVPTSGNVFVGYSYVHTDLGAPKPNPDAGLITIDNPTGLNGWHASLEGKVLPHVGLVADVSGQYGSQTFTHSCGFILPCIRTRGTADANFHNFLFGPRISASVGKFTPFAHAMLGFSRISETFNERTTTFHVSEFGFSDAVGGGLDYRLIPVIGWRVQVDLLQTRSFSDTQNNFRFSTGPVFRF